jgi:hypothetical protein
MSGEAKHHGQSRSTGVAACSIRDHLPCVTPCIIFSKNLRYEGGAGGNGPAAAVLLVAKSWWRRERLNRGSAPSACWSWDGLAISLWQSHCAGASSGVVFALRPPWRAGEGDYRRKQCRGRACLAAIIPAPDHPGLLQLLGVDPVGFADSERPGGTSRDATDVLAACLPFGISAVRTRFAPSDALRRESSQ